MDVAALSFLRFGPLEVFLGIPFVSFPWALVVFELQLIDHHDALIYWTDLRAFVAARAVFIRDVVQPIVCLVETLIWAFQPAERALCAKVEAHNGTLILGCAAFECLVARLSIRPQFEMALDGGNSGAFQELEPFGQNGDFMCPFDSFARLHRSGRRSHFVIRSARGLSAGRLLRV